MPTLRAVPTPPDSTQTVCPVIVSLPSVEGGLQVLVQHHHGDGDPWVEVAVRAESTHSWRAASDAGIDVEVRSA